MTESEWWSCNHPREILEFLRGRASDRKLRLLMLSCCRRVSHLLADKPYRRIVDVAERFIAGLAKGSELAVARTATQQIADGPLWEAAWYSEVYGGAAISRASMSAAAGLSICCWENREALSTARSRSRLA